MADNVTIDTVTYAADDIDNVLYPRVKLTWGANNTADDASAANPLPVQTYQPAATALVLTPSVPVPSGSDVVNVNGNAIVTGDLSIVDTADHWFLVPMAISGYRSCIVYLQNGASAWNQSFTVSVAGFFGLGTTFLAGWLGQHNGLNNAGLRWTIGTNDVGVGGWAGGATLGSSSGNAGYEYYSIPALSDGWPYIGVRIKFASAPTLGQLARFGVMRMRF